MKKGKKRKSRRDFLKKGVAGLAGITLAHSALPSQAKAQGSKSKEPPGFIYRTLGKTGLRLPIVSMGVMNARSPELVKAALDSGITHLDTAWYYQRGRNEEMIGMVIKNRPRDSYVIATKVWEPRDRGTDLFLKSARPASFIEKCETSLKRLGLSHVDILYSHSITRKESVAFEPYLDAMKKLKKEGKVRFIGISTHQNEPDVIRATVDCKEFDVILTSYNFKQGHRDKIKKAIDYAAKAGLGIIGMKAIAGSVYNIGKNIKVDAKAALKWALQEKNIHTNIPGFNSFDQMNECLSVMKDLKLSDKEKFGLEQIRQNKGLFCQQCGKCTSQCPAEIDIPTLMRSYMYAYGYRNLSAAKEALDDLDLSMVACKSCSTCKVTCEMGFPVKDRIVDIARLKKVPEEFLL